MTHRGLLLALMTLLIVDSSARAAAPAAVKVPPARPPETAAAPAPPKETPTRFDVLGSPQAPVTIVEFSDLQCPYCARYALETFPEIKRVFIDTGKVHYVAGDFPLPMHPYAFPAAVAARCAGEQGKFWQYREAFFADQSHLVSNAFFDPRTLKPAALDPFDAVAVKLRLDKAKFDACRRDQRQVEAVSEDLEMARQGGVTSTPSFVIGRMVDGEFEGKTFSGVASFAEMSARIEALLAAGK